ncbi:MAG TPA: formylglycine-generating enzyme family protein [Verrucomicrobiae bacterium]|nr:formylglycine-generating enzyme family protein [Verrucomicrobiae bacterium]
MSPDDLLAIPGGEYLMGQDDGRDDERPAHRVRVAPFRLCRHQVTNADYDAFRKATSREKSEYRDRAEFRDPLQPAVAVNWFDAVAYCHWLGAQIGMHVRLPTEAEWEFAARGGCEARLYPWGDALPEIPPDRWKHAPEPVMRGAPNGYGLFDMCQNVHEWCSDWYDPGYYAVSPAENPHGPERGKRRSSRGGAWRHHIKVARCAARSSIPPEFRYADYGFRVAAS